MDLDFTTDFQLVKDTRTLIRQVPFGSFSHDGKTIIPVILYFKTAIMDYTEPAVLGYIEEPTDHLSYCVHVSEFRTRAFMDLLIEALSENNDPSKVSPMLQQTIDYAMQYLESLLRIQARDKPRMATILYLKRIIKDLGSNTCVKNMVAWHDSLVDAEVAHRYMSSQAKKIQRRYRVAIADPSTELCLNRLHHEFYSMSEFIE